MLRLPTSLLRSACVALALGLIFASLSHADRSDRDKQMVIEADKPGTVDLQNQVVVFNGNVSISQGTLIIRANRVELRELPDGYREATAIGTPGHQASYSQKRDGLDETVTGAADRIEFDGRAQTLRFVGHGTVRRYRGAVLADEITGALIVWNATTEVFSVEGGTPSPANPGGRVRAVLSPRADAQAPADAGSAGSAASSASGSSLTLKPSRELGEHR